MKEGAIVIISKKLFIETMNGMKEYDAKMNAVDAALKELDRDFGGLYITAPFDLIIPVLEEIFHDKEEGWLSYFAYEKDWLRTYEPGDVTDKDGNEIDVSTWDRVYDFLTEEMEAND